MSDAVVVGRLLLKFHIECPPEVHTNNDIQRRFMAMCLGQRFRKQERVAARLLRAMKKHQSRKMKLAARSSLLPMKAFSKKFQDSQNSKIEETDWSALELFFGKDEDELKMVSKMPSAAFYRTSEWQSLRYFMLKRRGNNCECCGRGPKDDVSIHVDHIMPRSFVPFLSLNPTNLQILCRDCNLAKSNIDATDWRPD